MANIKAFLQKPFIQKVVGQLWTDALPRIRAKIGEDPAVAFGGLATFLGWLAGKLPAKIAKPVQGVVLLLGLLGVKATVTPAAAPKVIVAVPVTGATAPLTVKVPLVPPPVEHIQTAIQDAVAKATGALKGVISHGAR